MFEETDHFTLYPVYKYHRIDLSFDPMGGYFPYNADENVGLTFDDGIDDWDYSHDTVGKFVNNIGSQPYGLFAFPGHESETSGVGINGVKYYGCWSYGNDRKTMPKVRRNNYVFDRWVYLDNNGKEQEFTFETVLEKNMTVYAKWKSGLCSVIYDATEGELTKEECERVGLNMGTNYYNVTTGSTLAKDGKQLPVPTSKKGYQFLGWFTEDGKEFRADTQILQETYVKAQWSKLPGEVPVTLRLSANGGTFTDKGAGGMETSLTSREIKRNSSFGQLPKLDDRPEYQFLGWYVVKPGATEPYTDASFLSKVSESTRVLDTMINDKNEVLVMARWEKTERVREITVSIMVDKGNTVDIEPIEQGRRFEVIYTAEGQSVKGLGFIATVLPKNTSNQMVKWTSSNPNVIRIPDGKETIYSGNYFEEFQFGMETGETILTAVSEESPGVQFRIYVTVKK